MQKKYKIIFTISSIIISICIILGVSSAYFMAKQTGNESSATVGTLSAYLELTFTDGTPEIAAENIAPGWQESKYFFVTNSGTSDAEYDLKISNIVNTFTIPNSISYEIFLRDGTTIVPRQSLTNETKLLTQILKIKKGETQSFIITTYYDNVGDQTVDIGKNFAFTISITGELSSRVPTIAAEKILGLYNQNLKEALTAAGKSSSLNQEKALITTVDDYDDIGISYYYRGAVDNNYVSFANMCWRIVRITGNGAVKLVLFNYNPTGAANPCDENLNGTSNAFAHNGSTYTSYFNTTYNDNAYIGYMYGATWASTYAKAHANTNKSTVLKFLETWYSTYLTDYSNLLADVVWCNDKSLDTLYPYNSNKPYGHNSAGYSARGRIWANNEYQENAAVTLKCPNDSDGGSLSRFTVDDEVYGNGKLTYPIGLLTADEVAYAGGIFNAANSSYYLYQNASSTNWWTLSPSLVNVPLYHALHWHVLSNGGIYDLSHAVANLPFGVRPAIALKKEVLLTGKGTTTEPYVVRGLNE